MSAPFRFIAELLGGGGDQDLESVDFAPGSAQLMPPMREQLHKLLLAVFGRGGGDRAFYEALFERLVQIEPLPDTVLAALAAQRARAIADFIAQSGMDPARIGLGKAQIVEDRSAPIAATLALEAA